MSVLAAPQFNQSCRSATSASISTATSPWGLTSLRPSDRASRHCIRFVVCGALSHDNPALSSLCAGCQQSWLLPVCPVRRLRTCFGQIAVRAECQLIFSARRSEHISPLLRELHWLRVPERIWFRLCVLAFCCLHGTAPSYLVGSLCRAADVDGRRHLR